jgi:hypothetical protein
MLHKAWRFVEILLMLLGVVAIGIIDLKMQDSGLHETVQPPWSVRTLDDFRKWRPQYENAFRIEARGLVYYLVLGERARVLASGPSGYAFDGRGNFVGWILDTGDDSFLRVVKDETGRKALPVSAITIPATH